MCVGGWNAVHPIVTTSINMAIRLCLQKIYVNTRLVGEKKKTQKNDLWKHLQQQRG